MALLTPTAADRGNLASRAIEGFRFRRPGAELGPAPALAPGTRVAIISLCDWQRRFVMTRLALVAAVLMPRVLDPRRTLRIGGASPYKAEGCFIDRRSRPLRDHRKMGRLGLALVALSVACVFCQASSPAVAQPVVTTDHAQPTNSASHGPESPELPTTEIPSTRESSGAADVSGKTLCQELGSTAVGNDLPVQFFTRLIWQESRFKPSSVSRAGAQGIAQFMPATARWRKLANPFEPIEAMHEAARFLNELHGEFGNLGLAAAAYNAGPRRVRQWLAGLGHLPGETRAYVQAVTGRSVEEWAAAGVSDNAAIPTGANPCSELAELISEGQALLPAGQKASTSRTHAKTPAPQWDLQLIGDASEERALSAYRVLQKRFPKILENRDPLIVRTPARGPASWYRVRVAETSLQRANAVCAQLQSAGATCLVQRNQ